MNVAEIRDVAERARRRGVRPVPDGWEHYRAGDVLRLCAVFDAAAAYVDAHTGVSEMLAELRAAVDAVRRG